MPEDPIGDKAGNTTRCFQLLQYFQKNKDLLEVDFISFDNWSKNSFSKFSEFFPDINLKTVKRQWPKKKNYLLYFLIDKLPNLLIKLFTGSRINRCTPYINRHFKKVVKDNEYDISLISYAYWGKLQSFVNSKYAINDTHDFITRQIMVLNHKNPGKIGELFQEEVDILKQFDEVWSYSVEEHFIFEQFLDKTVQLMPISFPNRKLEENREIKHEVLYVASDNPHNKLSINWFVEHVLPLLSINITFVGKICQFIPDHPQIIKAGIVENLNEYYQKSKLTICPMVSGTGIKIKVLESLSFGIPVVANRRGVDGLINKSHNGCLVTNDPIKFAEYINSLLNDESLYHKISNEGSSFFEENYSKDQEYKLLDQIFIKDNLITTF